MEEEKTTMHRLSRRGFVLSGLAAATSAMAVAGCADGAPVEQNAAQGGEGQKDAVGEPAPDAPRTALAGLPDTEEGTWVTGACWHGCGGRCLNKVLVRDGLPVRQKTDDTHEDSPDYPQQRGCLRGRSQRKQVFGADRLRYPMKRVNFTLDEPNGHLRGRDEWERITWEEALDLAAEGLRRAIERYGNRSILVSGEDDIYRTLCLAGGCTTWWTTGSWGSWRHASEPIGFKLNGKYHNTVNDRLDMRNSEVVVMLGANPAWSGMGSPTWHYLQVKNAGAQFWAVDPFYNDSYALLDAQWCPIRPATDMAFLLGVANAMLELDEAEHLIDWDFLHTYCIGFDEQSMPEGADPAGNFKDYVLGTYDGEPKTPEWAEEICGCPAERMRDLARAIGKDRKVAILSGLANSRTRNSDNLPQMIMTLGAMGGHMGKSGHMTGSTENVMSANGGPALVRAGSSDLPAIENPVDDKLNGETIWRDVLAGSYLWAGGGTQPGQQRDIDIHVMRHGSRDGSLRSIQNAPAGVEAMRRMDMVVAQSYVPNANAVYADIVFPVCTPWEVFGGFSGGSGNHSGNREMLIMYRQVIDPLFEARPDAEVAVGIAERLGFSREDVYPFDERQQFFNQLASATVMREDGTDFEPLVTITQDDIDELGVEGQPQQGRVSWHEFEEAGVFQLPRSEGDHYGYIAYADFVADPDANPVPSESGKLEIFSQPLADMVNAIGNSEIRPIPTYIDVVQGYKATFSDWASKAKGDFPFQCFNPHYLRRAHSNLDNVQQLREAWRSPLFMAASDARERGLEDGQAVLIESAVGKSVRPLCVTERMIPGVVALPHGAWIDVDEEAGVELNGADNWLCPGSDATGQGTAGYNSHVVNVTAYEGELLPDWQRPVRVLEALEG